MSQKQFNGTSFVLATIPVYCCNLATTSAQECRWTKSVDCPVNPGFFGMSVVEYKGILYIFGGCDRNGTLSNFLYTFNTSTLFPHNAF